MNKNMKPLRALAKKLWPLIFLLPLFFLPIFLLRHEDCQSYVRREYYPEVYDVIVMKKYFDKRNHGAATLEFDNGKKMIPLDYAWRIFKLIEIGDTLIKDSNTLVFQIHKRDTILLVDITCQ